MFYYIKQFVSLAFLRIKPQDIKASYSLLLIVVLTGIALDTYALSLIMQEATFTGLLSTVTIYFAVMLSLVSLLMFLLKYGNRNLQTITAIAASGLIISLAILPGILVYSQQQEALKIYVLIVFIDNVWRILVNAHIFQHALSIDRLMAFIISVSYLLLGMMVADFLL